MRSFTATGRTRFEGYHDLVRAWFEVPQLPQPKKWHTLCSIYKRLGNVALGSAAESRQTKSKQQKATVFFSSLSRGFFRGFFFVPHSVNACHIRVSLPCHNPIVIN